MLQTSNKMSVGKKTTWINSFLLAALFALGFLGYWGSSNLHKRQNDIVNQLSAVRNITLIDMRHDAFYAAVVRGLLAAQSKNEADKASVKEEVQGFTEAANKNFDELNKLSLAPKSADLYKKVKPIFSDYMVEAKALVNLAASGNLTESSPRFSKFKDLFHHLESELDQLAKQMEIDSKDIKDISEQQAKFTEVITIVAMLAALILGVLLSIFRERLITGSVKQVIGLITTSSSEIATTVEQQERTISQQASSINETSTTIDELGAASMQSAEQAEASVMGARQVLELSENGTRAVALTLDGISNLKDNVRAIAEQIMHLSEQTGQISNISGLVADIANQTNMLALNAAVEAARAGEQGKGFSVVASEIRKLADESKKSAEKINTLVTDLQAAMSSTVMVTDEGTKKTEQSIKLAKEMSETFAGVTEAVNNVFLNSQQISLSSKQQAVAVQQVLAAMNAINMGSRETVIGINEVKVSTGQLNEAAKELQTIV
jgi:methyl-accepting chemotaxis protein